MQSEYIYIYTIYYTNYIRAYKYILETSAFLGTPIRKCATH